ncbi:MAG TPA: metallophosphoesterase [Bacilli bacterium]|nr:metallophosphoesterase [Bacilli bacterium]
MKKRFQTFVRRVFIIILLIGGFLFFQANDMTITNYTYESDKVPQGFQGYKILQLTDLHSNLFGKDNVRLLREIEKVNPDIIAVTGDMMNSLRDDGAVFLQLAEQLVKRYPVYYIDGNHELIVKLKSKRGEHQYYSTYIDRLEQLGVHIVNDKSVTLSRGEDKILLTGLDIPLIFYSDKDADIGAYEFNQSYVEQKIGQATDDLFHLLLVHNPDYFPVYEQWGANLVLAGHHHGGMIRIPFMGGLIGQNGKFELFPTYSAGEFIENETTMYVGRGLGNYSINLRLFNRPELVVVTLKR